MKKNNKSKPIPVIDLFAGPGGLGEGFSTCDTGNFKLGLSVEMDRIAHQTLTLRSFYRQFSRDQVPEEYYDVLRGKLTPDDLLNNHSEFSVQAETAKQEAWQVELGKVRPSEVDRRIQAVLNGSRRWVLIGGPPCQAYSLVGRSRNRGIKSYKVEDDHRNFLYKEYLRIIGVHSPAVFIMENVKGILSAKINGESIFKKILHDLQDPGRTRNRTKNKKDRDTYRIHSLVVAPKKSRDETISNNAHDFVVRSEEYGIPQSRHRVILLGIRSDLWNILPDRLVKTKRPVSVSDIIKGMPKLRSGLSKQVDSNQTWKSTISNNAGKRWLKGAKQKGGDKVLSLLVKTIDNINVPVCGRGGDYLKTKADFRLIRNEKIRKKLSLWFLDNRIGGLCNSTTRGHMDSDLRRYLYAACYASIHKRTPTLLDFPADLQPNHRNIGKGHFNDRFRVQLYSQPSSTITCHISKDGHYYIHPDPSQCRSLTVREAARLQTFPDNYFFCGNRTQQYIQVGNAVPPLLAAQIAEVVNSVFINSGLL